MRPMATIGVPVLLLAVALFATGCPLLPPVFEIWLVNTSGSITVTNLKLTSHATGAVIEFPEDLAPNTTRVIARIDASEFLEDGLTIEVEGESGGAIFEEKAEVVIDAPLMSGDTLPLVVSGNSFLTFSVEYVPLEASSKGLLLLRQGLAEPAGN